MGQPLQISESESNQLAKISTLFGIMKVTFQRPVTLFEGPLDAKFMSNSLALATAGRSTDEFDEIETVRYMFDNDETGKKKMIEKLITRHNINFNKTKKLKKCQSHNNIQSAILDKENADTIDWFVTYNILGDDWESFKLFGFNFDDLDLFKKMIVLVISYYASGLFADIFLIYS